MKKIFLFLIVFHVFIVSYSQSSSVLLQPNDENGIFSKRSTVLNPFLSSVQFQEKINQRFSRNQSILKKTLSAPKLSALALPATGEGTRLMWIPAKSAFRVGTIWDEGFGTDIWDDANIGVYSNAFGINTKASGDASTAMGSGNTASGIASTAMGSVNAASGIASTAMGSVNVASGLASTAMGEFVGASGEASVAMGDGTAAKTYGGISVGVANDNTDNPIGTSYDDFQSTDRIFQIGNGFYDPQTNEFVRGNALTVLRNGNIGIGNSASALAPAERLVVEGNVNTTGFTKLGSNAPKIKIIKLTGTTAATQGTYATPVPYGLNMDKILDIEVIIKPATNYRQVRGWRATAGYEFDFYFDTNNVQVYNVPSNSSNILNKAFTVFITYEE